MRIAFFSSEPLARLAASRLEEVGIPCLVRSEGVGPGGWGTAANIPYSVAVSEQEQWRAREVLGLSPAEVEERAKAQPGRRPPFILRLALFILALVLVLAVIAGVASRILR
ncbi:MAG: putative signal transducing protein [Dehalococcoidia bacterium]